MMPRIIEPTKVLLDRERTVLFTRAAVKAVERDLTRVWGRDYSFFEAIRRLSEMLLDNDLSKLSFINIAYLLWHGCQHEDPALTLETVEEALPYADPSGLIPYVGVLLQAWNAVSPAPEPSTGEVVEADPLGASPGTPSGALSGSVSG